MDGLNAGYARLLLEDYLENPDAVPPEWRALFESGDSELVASHPGLLRLLETLERNGGNGHAVVAAPVEPQESQASRSCCGLRPLVGAVRPCHAGLEHAAARRSRRARSLSLDVSRAALSNSARASSYRPISKSSAPRTLGKWW